MKLPYEVHLENLTNIPVQRTESPGLSLPQGSGLAQGVEHGQGSCEAHPCNALHICRVEGK